MLRIHKDFRFSFSKYPTGSKAELALLLEYSESSDNKRVRAEVHTNGRITSCNKCSERTWQVIRKGPSADATCKHGDLGYEEKRQERFQVEE